ncbi:MAG: T9SS type A sorting domain-containing protein [Bacteroidota bacterium]
MKKICSALIILVLGVTSSFAQGSFSISNVYVNGDPAFMLQGHATITNTSGSGKDVAVTRTVNNLYPGHVGYFCWFQCYPPNISVSPDFINIPAGGNINLFQADVETNAISGVSYNSYCFYDVNNPSDSSCVNFVFDATTGISEVSNNRNYISKPFPNPSSESASFYVNILRGSKARLKMFNMLGSEVKDVPLADNTRSSIKVNVSDLHAGLYFYSLYINGKSTLTGKLTVTAN